MNDKRVVIDASVALKWILRDEETLGQADRLLEDIVMGRLSVSVPTIFDYEIANVLTVAARRGRLLEIEGQLALVQSLGVWFFTGDKRLFNALGGALDGVKWIGDYDFTAIPER